MHNKQISVPSVTACLSVCPSVSNGTSHFRYVWLSVCRPVSNYTSDDRLFCLFVPQFFRLFHTAHPIFGMYVCLSVCPSVWNDTSEIRHVCVSVCRSVSNGTSEFRRVCLSVRLIQMAKLRFVMFVRLFQTAKLRFVKFVFLSVCCIRHIWGSACLSVCPCACNGIFEVLHVCLSVCSKWQIWVPVCLSVRLFQTAIWGLAFLSVCPSVTHGTSEVRHFSTSVCPSVSNGTLKVPHVCLTVRLFQTAHLKFSISVCLSVCYPRQIWGSSFL